MNEDAVNEPVLGPVVAAIPGENVLQAVSDGLMAWAVVIGIIGLVVAAITWILGSNSDNYQQSAKGKRGVVYVLIGVALIGAAPVLVQWAFDLGQTAG